MSISYNEQEQVFRLNTPDSTYIIGVVDEDKFLGHIYYGSRIEDDDVRYLMRTEEYPFKPSVNNRERLSFLDIFPMEYPTHGTGDYRENCLMIEDVRGQSVVSLSYKSHEIFSGKKKLQGLPATFGSEEECESLDIHP